LYSGTKGEQSLAFESLVIMASWLRGLDGPASRFVYALPPGAESARRLVQQDRLTDHRRQQAERFALARRADAPERFVPRMFGQAKPGDVRWKQRLCPQILGGAHGFFRRYVHASPAPIVLPVVQDNQVESAEPPSDLGKMRAVTAVAAEKTRRRGVSTANPPTASGF
jgi:hypothetical protein